MKKILVLILPVIAFLGGAVGGDMLHADKTSSAEAAAPGHEPASGGGHDAAGGEAGHDAAAETAEAPPSHGEEAAAGGSEDWFHFPNQFFVPILRNGTTTAVMVMSLTIEMPAEKRADIEAREHRLRDALLNALMVQANTGGFDGNFTAEPNLERLRKALLAAAQKAAGPEVTRVLIEDIARQDQ